MSSTFGGVLGCWQCDLHNMPDGHKCAESYKATVFADKNRMSCLCLTTTALEIAMPKKPT